MLLSEERYTCNCISFCDPHRLKSRCDSSHVNQRPQIFQRNYIPFLCPSVVILPSVGMDKFAPQILSTLIFYEANSFFFSNMNAECFPGTQVLNLHWMKMNLEADMSSSDMIFLMEIQFCVRTFRQCNTERGFYIWHTVFLLSFELCYTSYIIGIKHERG